MAFNFNPVNGLLDPNTFPTNPGSETEARQQFMVPLNQLKDYINQIYPDEGGYINATLYNGWTGYLRYKKLSNGLVHLIGSIIPGVTAAATLVSDLPAGYKPEVNEVIPVHMAGTTNTSNGLYLLDTGGIHITNQYSPIDGVNVHVNHLFMPV